MANLLLPSKRVITPGKIPNINRKNPLSDSLLFAYVPGCGQFDAVLRQQMLVNRREIIGKGGYCTDPTHATVYTEVVVPTDASAPEARYDRSVLTIVAVLRQTVDTNFGWSFIRGNGASTPPWGIGIYGGLSADGPMAAFGSYSYTPTTPDNTLYEQPRVVVLTADGATASLYLDGKLINSGGYTAPTYTYSSHRTVIIGSNGLGNGNNTENYLSVLFDRALTDVEVTSISENPWQIFARKSNIVYFNAASGGSTLVNTSLNSILQKLQTKTTQTDALLLKQSITRNTSLSSQVAKNLTKTAGNDALLLKAIQRQLQTDAKILKTLQANANISATLQKLNINYTSFDGILIAASGIQAVFDAIVQKGSLLNSQCDAAISKVFETYCSASAQLQKEMLEQTQFQAVLQKKQSAAAAMDSILILFGVTAVSTNLQALLQKSALLRTTNITSMLQKAQVSSTSLEAILTQLSGVTTELTALLQKNKIVFIDVNAALQKALQKTMVFSAILANLNLITLSLDAVLIQGELVFTANRTNTVFLQQEIRIVILENEIRIIPVEG